MLERRRVKHEVRLEFTGELEDAVAVANVGNAPVDIGGHIHPRQHLHHRVERRLGVFDHQQPSDTESHKPCADFRSDRTAATGDDHRLALDEMLQPLVIDLYARTQQQVLDIDWRETWRLATLVE